MNVHGAQGKDVNRQVKMSDISNIKNRRRLGDHFFSRYNYAIQAYKKRDCHIIKHYKTVVVPIVIDGFRRSFDKKGLRIKKKIFFNLWKLKFL